jgi:hypothetical protein
VAGAAVRLASILETNHPATCPIYADVCQKCGLVSVFVRVTQENQALMTTEVGGRAGYRKPPLR